MHIFLRVISAFSWLLACSSVFTEKVFLVHLYTLRWNYCLCCHSDSQSNLPSPLLHCLTKSSDSTTSPALKHKWNYVTNKEEGQRTKEKPTASVSPHMSLCEFVFVCSILRHSTSSIFIPPYTAKASGTCTHLAGRVQRTTHYGYLHQRERRTHQSLILQQRNRGSVMHSLIFKLKMHYCFIAQKTTIKQYKTCMLLLCIAICYSLAPVQKTGGLLQ